MIMHSIFTRLIALSAIALSSTSISYAQTKPASVQLSAGIYVIHAEVAATDAERQQGLMMRTKLASNEGMVFDFGAPAGVCMWMKNTLIPLSVAFIDTEGKIINIEDMQPETTDSHCAKKVVRYALEMNQDWFKQKNIKSGSKIEGLPLRSQ